MSGAILQFGTYTQPETRWTFRCVVKKVRSDGKVNILVNGIDLTVPASRVVLHGE